MEESAEVRRRKAAEAIVARCLQEKDVDACLALAAPDPNGFVREAVVRAVRDRAPKHAWPIALVGCDDWVPQVRAQAVSLARRLVEVDRAPLFEHLDLIVALRRRSRFVEATEGWLEAALHDPRDAQARWAALASPSATRRRTALDLIAESDPHRIDDACLRLASDPHPGIALHVLAIARDTVRSRVLEVASRNTQAAVRAAALRAKVEDGAPDSREATLRALFDHASAPRAAAAWLARNRFGVDPLPLWREAFDASHEEVALRALAQMGDASDVARFRAALQSGQAALRAAALIGIANFASETLEAPLLDALMDPSHRIARLAVRLAKRGRWMPTPAQVGRLYDDAADAATRTRLLSIAPMLGRWRHLDALLAWVADTRPIDRERLHAALREWLRWQAHGHVPLDDTLRARLRERIAPAHRAFPDLDWERMRFVVEH